MDFSSIVFRGCEKMILMASEPLFLAYNEILTTACIQGIQKEGGMQLEAKRGAPWPLKDFFHSLFRLTAPSFRFVQAAIADAICAEAG